MSLKKFIRKLTASIAAMLVIHSNCYMFGVGLSAVIAQDAKEPDINLNVENIQYVQFKEELPAEQVEAEQEQPEQAQVEQGQAEQEQAEQGQAVQKQTEQEKAEQAQVAQEQVAQEQAVQEQAEQEQPVQEQTNQAEMQENNETTEPEKQYYSGVAIKTKMQLSLEEQETNLPIKSSEIVISMPVLNNSLPERVNVVNASTALTTGENNNQTINQNYDSNSGLLTLSYGNENVNTNYNQESKDEFEIIYIYPAQAYTGNEEEISLQYNIVAKVNFETENANTTTEKIENIELIEKDNKGTLLTFTVTNLENNIYKGFMYSNIENGTNYETNYNTTSTMCVLDKNASNEITIEMQENTFILNNKQNTEISSEGKIIYKSTQISKTEFDKILGQEGNIEIYSNENQIATVKYIDVNENEQIVKRLAIIYSEENIKILSPEETIAKVEYAEGTTNLTIKTTQPVSEGYMNFKNENSIIATDNYIVNVAKIKSINTTSVINNNMSNVEIILQEPETKVTLNVSNTNFSTLQPNKTTLTINLDSTNESTKLFENPEITIKLPEGIINGNLSSPEIVNGNGLTIKNATATNNIIKIQLEGKQTQYDLNNVSGGASIVMDIENIEFSKTLPTHEDKITVTCTQQNEQIEKNATINIISKEGLLMMSDITGLEENQTITSIDNEPRIVEVKNDEQQKEIEQTITLVNNYETNLVNTQIIGKIGYIGEEQNSTFDLELAKPIQVENAKVYYSANKEAVANDETWSEEFNYQAKAYKIELNNLELEAKSATQIKIYFKSQANIGYNQKTYVKTEINYTCNDRNLNDSATFGIITPENNLATRTTASDATLTNEQGAQIPVKVTITPNITLPYVHSKQRVTYKIKVTNNGTQNLNNINIEDIIPENAIYTYLNEIHTGMSDYTEQLKDEQQKSKTWNIETLKPGETQEFEIMLTMADVAEEQEITNTVTLKCNNGEITTQNKLTLKPTKIQTTLERNYEELMGIEYNVGSNIDYLIKVKNTTEETLKNVKVQYELPETLECIEGGLGEYGGIETYSVKEQGTINNKTLEYNIKKLKPEEEQIIYVKAKVNKLTEGYEANITTIAKIITENDIYETNISTATTKQSDYSVKITSNIEENQILKKGDEVIYTIQVENVGAVAGGTVVKDTIPEQLDVYQIEEYVNGELRCIIPTAKKDIEWSTSYLDIGGTSTLVITTKVDNIEVEEVKNIEIENKATVSYCDTQIETEEEKVTIEPEQKTEETGYTPFEFSSQTTQNSQSNENNNEEADTNNQTNNEETNTNNQTNNKEVNNENQQQNTQTNEQQNAETSNQQNTQNNQNENNNQQTNNENQEQNKETNNNQNSNQNVTENTNSNQETANNENTNQTQNNNQTQQTPKTYSISGNVWQDTDKNGAKDETETSAANITVTLINMNIGNFATDENGNIITVTTDENGNYAFKNITEGEYAVMFEFDTQNYTVTTYQKESVEQNKNSNAILSDVTINGTDKKVALTDKLQLNENKENINLGIVENPTFDLSLNKQITKITVVNKKGTHSYEYQDGHTAKVELEDKYMSGSEIIVNYKFTITNNGGLTGYINNLKDTLPEGLTFNSEINPDWYKDSDGNLYTPSLAGKAIKPGESIEIELTLTKTMTENNAGTFINSAKLEKISNLENIQEKTEAQENNQSSATLIISLKTGSAILYIGILITSLMVIGIGTYLIKKKVLIEKI